MLFNFERNKNLITFVNCFWILWRSALETDDHSFLVETFSSSGSWDSALLMAFSCPFDDSSSFSWPQVMSYIQLWTCLSFLPGRMPSYGFNHHRCTDNSQMLVFGLDLCPELPTPNSDLHLLDIPTWCQDLSNFTYLKSNSWSVPPTTLSAPQQLFLSSLPHLRK